MKKDKDFDLKKNSKDDKGSSLEFLTSRNRDLLTQIK